MDTQNYKRTLAGSVGAGMGALMGASGRTYFILEHKTSSKYHQAGESQKIIVDQVELGRDASCQVRFDESFETVSRKHAAIVRDGENWKLIHLSHSNPTLVNGHPINGSYYLQTGDEIQLSVGGPRLGFIVPQGRQALTSSIGLTERMSLFRKQALRPYKTALTIMGIVFVLAVAGLAAWNYSLGVKNDLLAQKTEEQELQLKGYQNQLDSLGTERASLEAQQRELETKLRNSDGNAEALKTQLDNVNSQLKNVNASFYKVKSDLDNLSNSISTKSIENSSNAINANIQEGTRLSKDQYYEDPDIADEQDSNASGDLKDQYAQSETRYYQIKNYLGGDSIEHRNQYITMPTKNYNYTAQFTYSEPIARATFLQFSYRFQYKNSKSDKSTYDLGYPWDINDGLPENYETAYVDSLSKDAEYKYFNHDISLGLRFIREKYQLSAGMSLQPQNTKLSYKKGDYMTDTTRTVFNFAPNLDFRYRFSKVSQLRITYRGRSSQPSMENLLPIVDNSNPLNIRVGNPGLKPSFAHTMRLFYNTYNAEKQRGIMTHVNFTATQNSISNSTVYDENTGGTTSTPQNINGNWNAFGLFGFNSALKNKKFTINSFSRVSYRNQVAFLYNKETLHDDKNTTTGLTLAENLNGSYRNDWFEFSLNGSIEYTAERSKLRPEKNQNPYTFSYGASTNVTLPWQMTLSTNITNQSRRGYDDASLNNNELIWNAQIAQSLLKGAATVSFEMYDILKQQSNISRSLTADVRSVTEYNSINSYCMVHFIYRLNIFGSKAARDKMMNSHRGFGGPGFGPGPGRHGRRPF